MKLITSILITPLFLVCSVIAGPQQENSIYGTIKDQSGSLVHSATVDLKSSRQKMIDTRTTNSGEFTFDDIEPGSYLLVVKADGYKAMVVSVKKAKNQAFHAPIILEMISFHEWITVIGSRAEMEIADYPGSVDVIEGDDFLGSSSTIENLSQIPGFETGGGHSRNIGQQFTIRGFGYQSEERVIIKQDGVRRSANLFSNHISTFRTEPEILKKVEAVKGASSVSHGGGAIGGIIGMTTKDPSDYLTGSKNLSFNITSRLEDNEHQSFSATVAGRGDNGKLSYMVFGKQAETGDLEPADSEEETVENDENIDTYFGKVVYRPTDTQYLSLSFFHMNEDIETVWQTVYHGQFPQDGPVIGELRQEDLVLTYNYKPDSDWIDFTAKAYSSEGYYDRTADYTSNDILVDYKNEDKSRGVNLKNIATYIGSNVTHHIVVGMDFDNREEDATYVRNGVPSDFGSMPNDYKDYGFYFQDNIFLLEERLMLLIAGRYDQFDRSVDHIEEGYDASRFSPRAGVSYEVMPGLRLLGNYSEAFRAPTPHETSSYGPLNPHYWYLPNPDLKPETAGEYEGGFSYLNDNLNGGTSGILVKGMYFNGDIDQMISFRTLPDLGDSPDGSPYGTYQNVDDAKREGYEFSFNYYIGNWSTDGSFEHLDLYDEETKEKVPNAFADKARLSLSYKFPSIDVILGGDVSHWFEPDQNPESIFSRGTEYFFVTEEFTISNFWVRWKPNRAFNAFFDRSFEFHIGVNNAFNDRYINARNVETTTRSGKGRNVWMSLTKTF
ncbi:TonB-dependent receptor [Sulfidibacter corallicola]|uniref:TonB-dependent receptor n=1 Tax=Sulfidibacter corallicola TaxID=2818388 RepID=A0A8A4TRR3_SULCO|nr:TonB-dependent receptor [Sulfidibacter corallicola]QTD51762.1 TonB-dependent receptor [Sulfidibacter corallicola]